MSDTGSTQNGEPVAAARARSPGLGRRVGIALFWLMAAYVIGMAAFSIIPSLFFPGLAPMPPGEQTRDCARALSSLERDLRAHAAAYIAQPGGKPLAARLEQWDRRYQQLPRRCGALQATRDNLAKLRAELPATLQRHGALQRKVRKALDAIEPSP